MDAAAERLSAFRTILASARERIGLPLGFVLWDGSTVPDNLAPDALALVFADEGAIAGLVRKPRLETISNLWVAKRIDLRNGTLLPNAPIRLEAGSWVAARAVVLRGVTVGRGAVVGASAVARRDVGPGELVTTGVAA